MMNFLMVTSLMIFWSLIEKDNFGEWEGCTEGWGMKGDLQKHSREQLSFVVTEEKMNLESQTVGYLRTTGISHRALLI